MKPLDGEVAANAHAGHPEGLVLHATNGCGIGESRGKTRGPRLSPLMDVFVWPRVALPEKGPPTRAGQQCGSRLANGRPLLLTGSPAEVDGSPGIWAHSGSGRIAPNGTVEGLVLPRRNWRSYMAMPQHSVRDTTVMVLMSMGRPKSTDLHGGGEQRVHVWMVVGWGERAARQGTQAGEHARKAGKLAAGEAATVHLCAVVLMHRRACSPPGVDLRPP